MCVLEMDSNSIAVTHLFYNIVVKGVFYFIWLKNKLFHLKHGNNN